MKTTYTISEVAELAQISWGPVVDPYFKNEHVAIYHADCFDVLHGLEGLEAVVTDPPYSSGGQFRGDRVQTTVAKYVSTGTAAYRPEFAGDNRDQRSYLVWSMLWMGAARSACVPGAPFCVFTDWRQVAVTIDALQCAGLIYRNLCTWWKPGVRMQKGRFSSSAEFIVYGTNGPVEDGGAESRQNVFSCSISANKDRIHIAEKPLPVMDWLLGVVPAGGLVFDPFMGSGSTLRAAADRGLRAVGVDIDEANCETAARRMEQQTLQLEPPRPREVQAKLFGESI